MKKIGLIALIVVLSLGIIGVGYAAWSQTLTLTGTVNAGKFDVQFANAVSNDETGILDPLALGTWTFGTPPYTWAGTQGAADVASTLKTNATYITTVGSTNNTLQFTVTNAYPGYMAEVAFAVVNSSTVPVSITVTPHITAAAGSINDLGVTYTKNTGDFASITNAQFDAGTALTAYTLGAGTSNGFITIGVGNGHNGATTDPPMGGTPGSYTVTLTIVAAQGQ
jgi:predicted ribosomally synthesized peptide with SipW-like signal peptide